MPKKKFNPYETLGVAKDATDADIKAAARAHAGQSHPDKGGDAEEFHAGRRALAVLTDPKKRKKFDQTGDVDDDSPDNVVAEARGLIDRCVGEAISAYLTDNENPMRDPRTIDLVDVIRNALNAQIAQAENEIIKCDRQTVFFKDFIRRWKFKKRKGFDFLKRRFEDELAKAKNGRADVVKSIETRRVALTIIEDYAFEFDAPMPVAGSAWVHHGNTVFPGTIIR